MHAAFCGTFGDAFSEDQCGARARTDLDDTFAVAMRAVGGRA